MLCGDSLNCHRSKRLTVAPRSPLLPPPARSTPGRGGFFWVPTALWPWETNHTLTTTIEKKQQQEALASASVNRQLIAMAGESEGGQTLETSLTWSICYNVSNVCCTDLNCFYNHKDEGYQAECDKCQPIKYICIFIYVHVCIYIISISIYVYSWWLDNVKFKPRRSSESQISIEPYKLNNIGKTLAAPSRKVGHTGRASFTALLILTQNIHIHIIYYICIYFIIYVYTL